MDGQKDKKRTEQKLDKNHIIYGLVFVFLTRQAILSRIIIIIQLQRYLILVTACFNIPYCIYLEPNAVFA